MIYITKLPKIVFPVLLALVLAGCAGTRTVSQEDAKVHLANSDYKQYAQQYLDKDGKPTYDKESLLDVLEAAKAFHDAGRWQESAEAFDIADGLMLWKADTIDTPAEVVNLMGTTLTSDAFGAYQGKIYQGGLIDYYQTINMLMLGNEGNARVSFNRLEVRQDNALTQLTAYAQSMKETADEQLGKEEAGSSAQSLEQVGDGVNAGLANVPTGLNNAKIRNSAGDVMSALFRASSSSRQDKSSNKSTDSLKRASAASATTGGGQLVKSLQQQLRKGKGELKNKVIVVYEDGTGPTLSEFRIDLPLFIVTDKVTYTGIALPRFEAGLPAYGQLKLANGKAKVDTVVLTDLNQLAGLEFQKGYNGMVTKAVVSTVIKTVAQAVINHQIDQQTGGGLMGSLMKLGVGAAQYALTKADTRAWANLPNTIQMAIIERPKDNMLTLQNAVGDALATVDLPVGNNTLVVVKASGAAGKPAIYTQSLPVADKVASL